MADEPLSQRFTQAYAAGTVLFREGEPGHEMYVVQSGSVHITRGKGPLEKLLATLGQGEFFGEMSILNNAPRSATATVAEEARLLVIDPKTFDAMIRGNAEIAVRMIKKLADRLGEADAQIENLLHRDPATRVVHWLVQQAERSAAPGGLLLPVTAEALPSRVGVEPEAVAEALARLEKAKLVQREAGGLQLAEVAKLRHFLEFLKMRAQYGDRA